MGKVPEGRGFVGEDQQPVLFVHSSCQINVNLRRMTMTELRHVAAQESACLAGKTFDVIE